MPRQTLKLPKKSVTKPATTARDASAPSRKPIRGGAPTARHIRPGRSLAPGETSAASMPERRDSPPRREGPARTTSNPEERPTRSAPQRSEADHNRPATADAAGGRSRPATAREPASPERPGSPAKIHPPRGMARSTGVRASPPAPRPPTSPPAPRAQGSTPSGAPPPADAASHSGEVRRGLAKEPPRLSRLVSETASCSRRQADEWIENGWVSVDGVVVSRLGARVNPQATIRIQDAASRHHSESVTILYNQPRVAGNSPPEDDRSAVVRLLRADNHWQEDSSRLQFRTSHLRGLASAGRPDSGETGMLVFTHEGGVARRVTGGDAKLEKEYHVRIEGELPAEALERLRHGLLLDGIKLRPAQVSWLGAQLLRFVLHENRKRQIQRMCELVGTRATTIKRVRIGSVSLGPLPPGQWRYLRSDERF